MDQTWRSSHRRRVHVSTSDVNDREQARAVTMADYKVMNNNQPAAAATSLLVSKDKEEVSPPLPVVAPVAADDDVKQTKAQRPLLAAVLVDAKKPPASPVAVLPADDDNKNNKTPPPPPVADRILLTVCLWALVHAFAFAVADIAILVANRNPCTMSTWLFPCVALTNAAAAEVSALLHGELWCSAAAAVAAPLHLLLTKRRRTTTSCMRGRWAAAVDALAWVALAATAGIHFMQVASDRFYLAADPGDTYFFVDVVLASGCLAADLLAGLLLCCRSPRRLVPGDQQSDDGEV